MEGLLRSSNALSHDRPFLISPSLPPRSSICPLLTLLQLSHLPRSPGTTDDRPAHLACTFSRPTRLTRVSGKERKGLWWADRIWMRGMRAQAGRTGSSSPSSFFQSPHTSRECRLRFRPPRARTPSPPEDPPCTTASIRTNAAFAARRPPPTAPIIPTKSIPQAWSCARKNERLGAQNLEDCQERPRSFSCWQPRSTSMRLGLWPSPDALVREPVVCARVALAITRTQRRYVPVASAAMQRRRTLRTFQNTVQARAE